MTLFSRQRDHSSLPDATISQYHSPPRNPAATAAYLNNKNAPEWPYWFFEMETRSRPASQLHQWTAIHALQALHRKSVMRIDLVGPLLLLKDQAIDLHGHDL